MMQSYTSAFEYLRGANPENPVVALRPFAATRAARWFTDHFRGDVLYALKANSDPLLVDALMAGGITKFDVASIAEIEFLSRFTGLESYFMHPVKSRQAISRAYHEFGVRHFCLDSLDELKKIEQETGGADDLSLYVRIACSGDGACIALDGKFGVDHAEAVNLLMRARQKAANLGVVFHVGSQAMQIGAFAEALSRIGDMIITSGVIIDRVDVGGGFPSLYPDMAGFDLPTYLSEIHHQYDQLPLPEHCRLMCEPGRALVSEASSLIVKVLGRKGNTLYLNDGVYGALYDAGMMGFKYPVRYLGEGVYDPEALSPFKFYGPTCDSLDFMPGPFYLPEGIKEGDHIEVGQTGAYAEVLRTGFNGFGDVDRIILQDEPLMGQFTALEEQARAVQDISEEEA